MLSQIYSGEPKLNNDISFDTEDEIIEQTNDIVSYTKYGKRDYYNFHLISLCWICHNMVYIFIFTFSKQSFDKPLDFATVHSLMVDTDMIDSCQSKKEGKDQESIQSSTTPDPGYQWESDKLTVDTTNESQEVSPFPAGDHKASINRCAQRHSKHKTEQKHKRSTKEVPPWNGQ